MERNVRVTTTGVYKWEAPREQAQGMPFEEKRTHNGAVLAIGILVIGALVFAATHAALIKSLLGL